MNERAIWIVRIIGMAVILLLLFLLMSLHSRLVRLNQEQPKPKSGATLLVDPEAERVQGAHA